MTPGPRLTHPSPNFGDRRDGLKPRLIVLHYTAMESTGAALARLSDPRTEVSAHHLICRTGAHHTLVAEDKRAWHAGAGCWQGCRDVNSASIGIELDNDGQAPFPEAQIAVLETALGQAMRRWGIPPEGLIGHQDMAPGRKSDPGPLFPWRRLAMSGLSVWPDTGAPGDFEADLHRFGYPSDAAPDALIEAFRARFRPGATGPLSDEDRALAAGLANGWGVDRSAPEA